MRTETVTRTVFDAGDAVFELNKTVRSCSRLWLRSARGWRKTDDGYTVMNDAVMADKLKKSPETYVYLGNMFERAAAAEDTRLLREIVDAFVAKPDISIWNRPPRNTGHSEFPNAD